MTYKSKFKARKSRRKVTFSIAEFHTKLLNVRIGNQNSIINVLKTQDIKEIIMIECENLKSKRRNSINQNKKEIKQVANGLQKYPFKIESKKLNGLQK